MEHFIRLIVLLQLQDIEKENENFSLSHKKEENACKKLLERKTTFYVSSSMMQIHGLKFMHFIRMLIFNGISFKVTALLHLSVLWHYIQMINKHVPHISYPSRSHLLFIFVYLSQFRRSREESTGSSALAR
jgi:hypothetical protein